jgi:hypothetical protein
MILGIEELFEGVGIYLVMADTTDRKADIRVPEETI